MRYFLSNQIQIHIKHMLKICIVTTKKIEKIKALNYMFFSNALNASGHEVWICSIDSLSISQGTVTGKALLVNFPLIEGEIFPIITDSQRISMNEFDYIWILSLIEPDLLINKIEILYTLSKSTKIINSLDALLYLNSKFNTIRLNNVEYPETYISSDFEFLWSILSSNDSNWIVKPPTEYSGIDVYHLSSRDKNAKTILKSLTGYNKKEKYCVLQKQIGEEKANEIRIIIANGNIVGQYKKANNVRTDFELHKLTKNEIEFSNNIGYQLKNLGALYVGVDIIYPYIIETNVLNPGGISKIIRLTGEDISTKIINKIFCDI